MVGVIQNPKDKIMFEIYKESSYSDQYRVVYFTELHEHNKEREIDRAMKGEHVFDGYILSLKKERAMKKIGDIINKLNEGKIMDPQYIDNYLEEFLVD
ncbi:MAG TPA: hypothetical protein QF697_06630 [Candidatus Marinimicrobia bacterium]|jgi:hypothetical protein|nr:hypothetical protein [Candidatus Neomarinimicrobiota bacterium]|tara:strand:- start:378 stop:671 length:294 start_codon:yes stop_codon:yes gene_type:complete